MRLGQLSRKLSVRQADIVQYLRERNIVIEDSVNSKVEEVALRIVLDHFAPPLNPEATLSREVPVAETEAAAEREQVAALDDEDVEPADPAPPEGTASRTISSGAENASESETDQTVEYLNEVNGVIKAPKVELKGLKVLGKIELPQPKKAEVQEPAPEASKEQPGERSARTQRSHEWADRPAGRKNGRKQARNPVAAERERLAREAAEKRKREIEEEKERRRQHYDKRIKPKGPTKAARIYEETVTIDQEPLDEPKTLWGRFVRWLTSY